MIFVVDSHVFMCGNARTPFSYQCEASVVVRLLVLPVDCSRRFSFGCFVLCLHVSRLSGFRLSLHVHRPAYTPADSFDCCVVFFASLCNKHLVHALITNQTHFHADVCSARMQSNYIKTTERTVLIQHTDNRLLMKRKYDESVLHLGLDAIGVGRSVTYGLHNVLFIHIMIGVLVLRARIYM